MIEKTTALKYVDKDEKENVTYSYRVKAVTEKGGKIVNKSELSNPFAHYSRTLKLRY